MIATSVVNAATEFNPLVFVANDPGTVDFLGEGRVCFSGPLEGPTHVFIKRDNSDAAITAMASRFGVDVAAMLSFRDASNVGDRIELAPHRLDS